MPQILRQNLSVIYALVLAGLMMAIALPVIAAETKDPDAPATPVVHNPIIQVEGDYILLGDLFDPVDKYADRVVARAPNPGQELVLPATWLWKAAKTFGIDWQPHSAADSITVTRPSSVVAPSQIGDMLRDAYFQRTGQDELIDIDTAGPLPRIDLPVTVAPTARLERFELDTRSGRFTATVVAPATGRTLEQVHVSGRFARLVEVPVPVNRFGKGHILTKDDIVLQKMREESLGSNLIVDPEKLIGQSVYRTLTSGEPIRAGDVRPPVLVEKNRIITVTLHTGSLVLTVQGKALQNGAMNDTIRVQNTQSTTVIDAVVTGPGRAEVPMAEAVAIATQ